MRPNNPTSETNSRNLRDSRVLAEVMEKAKARAVKQAIAAHHRAGDPVVIWRGGQVICWYSVSFFRPVEGESVSRSG
jgi:hypothetical protein